MGHSFVFFQVTDLAGSSNFVLLALYTYSGSFSGAFSTRAGLLTSLDVLSRVELASFLFFRVLVRGKDARFDAIRNNFRVSGMAARCPGVPVAPP